MEEEKKSGSLLMPFVYMGLALLYVISPIDILPGLPIDDIIVMLVSLVASIKEIKESLSQITVLGKVVIVLLVVIIITMICCKIF